MAKQVRTVYGQALFDAARESGRLTEVREQAEVIVSALEENPDFLRILTHPEITLPEKQAMVDGVFAGKTDSLIHGLISALLEKEHGLEIGNVLERFIDVALEAEKIGVAYVSSATELTDDQKARIRQRLLDTTDYVDMRVNYVVDPSLIGGLVIRLGDRIVDSSLSSQLGHLRQTLLAGD